MTVATLRGDSSAVMLVSLSSGEARPVLGHLEGSADWSPDGGRLLYEFGVSPSDLAILTLADSAVRRLTDTPDLDETDAVWSPDGETIVFVRSQTSKVMMTVDVGGLIGN